MPEGTTTISRPGAGKPSGLKALVKDKRTLYVAGAVVVGAAGYAWFTQGKAEADDAESLLFDEFGNPIAGPTPGLTEPQVLDSNLSTTIGTGLRTNAEWSQAASDYLEGRGYNAQAVIGALAKFLQRRPLTTVEADIVGAAVATQGWPPEDRPWTIIPTSPGATTPDPGPTKLPAPASVKATGGRARLTASWSGVAGATGYETRYVRGYPQGTGGLVVKKGATSRSHTFVQRVTRTSTYTVEVRTRNAAGVGPWRRSGPAKVTP
jgi:hypothetical protein